MCIIYLYTTPVRLHEGPYALDSVVFVVASKGQFGAVMVGSL